MTTTTVATTTSPPGARRGRLVGWALLGLAGSLGLVCFGSAIGATPGRGGVPWWYTVAAGTSFLAHVGFTLSLTAVVGAWVGVGFEAHAGRLTTSWAWILLALWGIPLLLGIPLFSRDLYSYVAQGQLVHIGLNPYRASPADLGPGPVLSSVASVWRHTASPYGPLFVAISRGVAAWFGPSMVAQIMVYRLVELAGVVLAMISLPALARQHGADPGLGLWLGVLSPLALWSFLSSGHNDGAMLGLLLAGLVMAGRGRLLLGVALCALAATIKLPALAGVVFLVAADVASRQRGQRWKASVGPVAVATGVIVGVTIAAGYGWGWLGPAALRIPTQLRVLTTPVVSIGTFLWGILHLIGLPWSRHATVTVVQFAAELAAGLGVVWLLLQSGRYHPVRLLGCALLLFVACSPTVWPWYWTWPLAVLAATGAQRSRALAVVAGLAMVVVGAGGTPMLTSADWWVSGPILLAVLVVVTTGGRWRHLLGPVGGDRPVVAVS